MSLITLSCICLAVRSAVRRVLKTQSSRGDIASRQTPQLQPSAPPFSDSCDDILHSYPPPTYDEAMTSCPLTVDGK